MSLWGELRRRKVVQVAAVYAVVSWLLVQIVSTIEQPLNLPPWFDTGIIIMLAVGFPVAVILAWAFDLGPQGIQPAADITAGIQPAPGGGRFVQVTQIVVLVAIGFLVADQYWLGDETPAANADTSRENAPVAPTPLKRTTINIRDDMQIASADLQPLGAGRVALDLAPDGTSIVYVLERNGTTQLYLRHLDEIEAQPIPGTEGGYSPFFSPDSQWIGFLTPSQIMKVSVRGGTPQYLTDAGNVFGIDWDDSDAIVFSEREGLQLSEVSASGGNKRGLLRGNIVHPEALPGGEAILVADRETDTISVFSRDTGELRPLIDGGSYPKFVPTGHIVFTMRGDVMTVPFDLETLTLSGSAVPILTDAQIESGGIPQLSFSADGWLAYVRGTDMSFRQPVWVYREGGDEELIPLPPDTYGSFRLSPDGASVAIVMGAGSGADIHRYDFGRSSGLRALTAGGRKSWGAWSHDAASIIFTMPESTNDATLAGIWRQRLDGGQAERIVAGIGVRADVDFWSPEIGFAVTFNVDRETDADIVIFSEQGERIADVATTDATEWGPTISPDGRFIAYTSDETGEYQINVTPFPPTGQRWVISDGYGEEPFWSAAGNEIFYRRGNQWFSVAVGTEPAFDYEDPVVVVEGPYGNVPGISYAVTPDAQRFMLLKNPEQPPATRIELISGWFDELRRIAPPALQVSPQGP